MLNSSQALIMTKDHEIIHKKDKIDLSTVDLSSDKFLVKIILTPLNPSDYYFCCHIKNRDKPLPCIPGFEAYGEIVGVDNPKDRPLLGSRVLVIPLNGTYCSYVVVDRKEIVFVNVDNSQAKKYFAVNPLTAMGLMEYTKNNNTKCVIQTGASTQVGKMITKLAREQNIITINIIRSEKHREVLKKLGGDYVLNSNSPGFVEELDDLCRRLCPTVALDCVGGELASLVFKNLTANGTLVVYGLLSLVPVVNIDCNELISKEKKIEGFHVFHSFWKNKRTKDIQKMLEQFYKDGFDGEDKINYFGPENFRSALEQWPNRNSKFIMKF